MNSKLDAAVVGLMALVAFTADCTSVGAETNSLPTAATTNLSRSVQSAPTHFMVSGVRKNGRSIMVTNVVRRVQWTGTNLTFKVLRPDGSVTNLVIAVGGPQPSQLQRHPRLRGFDQLGDYWLPGEFQDLLQKKRQESKQKEK